MLLKKLGFYRFIIIGLCIGTTLSCEDEIREVTLFEKGSIEAGASTTTIIEGESVSFTSTSNKVSELEWTFPGGDPTSSLDPNPTVTFARAGTFEVELDVKYIDNTEENTLIMITVVEDPNAPPPPSCGGAYGTYDIAFVTDNVGADAGFISLLESAGHTVEAEAEKYNNLDGARANELNDFDLVIISRNTNSVNIGGDASALASIWASVDVPVLNMNAFTARSSRLQLFNSTEVNEAGGTSYDANIPEHPIFSGITLTDGNTGPILSESGFQTVTVGDVGSGTLIASDADKIGIVEWDANVEFYAGAIPATGKRMFMSSPGGYFLTEVGDQLFLNVVEYLVSGSVPTSCDEEETPAGPLSIAIATNSVENEAGYVSALEAAGHTVEVVASKYEDLTGAGVTELNGFDLVIISRSNSSGAYGGNDPDVRARWMSVTTPVLVISPYVARMSRLELLNNDGGQDGAGNALDVVLEDHPAFSGVDITDGSTGDITTTGLDVVTITDAGNGSVIATTGPNGYIALAEWDENTAGYDGAGTQVGKRMFMAAAGTYGFNDAGTRYFLNVVNYIAN